MHLSQYSFTCRAKNETNLGAIKYFFLSGACSYFIPYAKAEDRTWGSFDMPPLWTPWNLTKNIFANQVLTFTFIYDLYIFWAKEESTQITLHVIAGTYPHSRSVNYDNCRDIILSSLEYPYFPIRNYLRK